jgi:hypothetical protein
LRDENYAPEEVLNLGSAERLRQEFQKILRKILDSRLPFPVPPSSPSYSPPSSSPFYVPTSPSYNFLSIDNDYQGLRNFNSSQSQENFNFQNSFLWKQTYYPSAIAVDNLPPEESFIDRQPHISNINAEE